MKSVQAATDLALESMERALVILDEIGVPADIGAHLDLAIERLRAHLNRPREGDDDISAAGLK